MNKINIVQLLFCFFSFNLYAQNEIKSAKSTFALSLYGSAGLTKLVSQSNDSKSDIHPSFSFGLQWKPNHLLNIGIESGFVNIDKNVENKQNTEFGTTSFSARLSAVPVILVFNMKIWKIDVYGGMGISNVYSVIEAFNEKNITNRWFYTYYAAIGYIYPINRFAFSTQAKIYSFSKLNKAIAGVMLTISYDFYKW